MSFNVLFNHANFNMEEGKEKVYYEAFLKNDLLLEAALGYDFGRIVPRLYYDFGMPLPGAVRDAGTDLSMNTEIENSKLGLEIGFKIIKTRAFNLTIPVGGQFSRTTISTTEPLLVLSDDGGALYDRIWDFRDIDVFTGITMTFQLNNHFKFGIFSRAAYPVKRDFIFREKLRGNHLWGDAADASYSIKSSYIIKDPTDILSFLDAGALSAGLGILANF